MGIGTQRINREDSLSRALPKTVGTPRDVREQRLEGTQVPFGVGYYNGDGQRDSSGAFDTQRCQSLPYR